MLSFISCYRILKVTEKYSDTILVVEEVQVPMYDSQKHGYHLEDGGLKSINLCKGEVGNSD